MPFQDAISARRSLQLIVLSACAAFAAGLLTGCGANADSQPADGAGHKDPALPVEVATVALGDVASTYEGTATLESERRAHAVAKLGGVLLEILVEEGDRVRPGQVLARLERERYEIQLEQIAASVRKLENELARASELHQRKLISTDEYERIRFDTEAQRAALELAQLDLDHTEIRAPIGGIVSERLVKVGNLVTQNQPLFVIDDFDPLWAVLHVPERKLGVLEPGQTARMQIDAYGDETFVGKVLRISPVVNAETGTFRVTTSFSDPEMRLRPGLFGRIRIVHDQRHQVPVVPGDALMNEDGGHAVFVLGGASDASGEATVERREVRIGYSGPAGIEIVDGLAPGERVITAGKNSLRDGARVRVVES